VITSCTAPKPSSSFKAGSRFSTPGSSLSYASSAVGSDSATDDRGLVCAAGLPYPHSDPAWGRRICFFLLFTPKRIPRHSALSKVARSSFVFSGVMGRDFHASYWWAEGSCNTPRNEQG